MTGNVSPLVDRAPFLVDRRASWPGRIRCSEAVVTALVERTWLLTKMPLSQVGNVVSGRLLTMSSGRGAVFCRKIKKNIKFLFSSTEPCPSRKP